MTTWFSSDFHLQHKNIIKFDGRPFKDIDHHDEMLIKHFNDVVMPWDTLIVLGDVALGPWPVGIEKICRFNGRKVLVPGNHDRISSVEKEARRERFRPDYEAVFDEIWDEVVEYDLQGTKVYLSHYPHTGDHGEDRFEQLRPVDDGTPIVHGHTHAKEVLSFTQDGTVQVHVGVTSWGYRPVHENRVLAAVRSKGIAGFDSKV